jgi:HTH-type transcriptional regulator, sugar sensing transcriptional regulator
MITLSSEVLLSKTNNIFYLNASIYEFVLQIHDGMEVENISAIVLSLANNMQSNLESQLVKIGLSQKEASVYLALLTIGNAHVKELVSQTGINRSTMYVVLDQLTKRGFTSISNKKGVLTYAAASPERLVDAIRENTRQIVLGYRTFAALTPELSAVHKNRRFKPHVTVYEGTPGLKKLFEDSLINEEKIMRVFSSANDIYKSLPDYLPLFIQQRMKRGIRMLGIHPDDEASRKVAEYVLQANDEITLIPKEKFTFPSDITVYDNTVAFMSHNPAFGVKIESKEIAQATKVLMDLAQSEARRFKQ